MGIKRRIFFGYMAIAAPLALIAFIGVLQLRSFSSDENARLQRGFEALKQLRLLRTQFEDTLVLLSVLMEWKGTEEARPDANLELKGIVLDGMFRAGQYYGNLNGYLPTGPSRPSTAYLDSLLNPLPLAGKAASVMPSTGSLRSASDFRIMENTSLPPTTRLALPNPTEVPYWSDKRSWDGARKEMRDIDSYLVEQMKEEAQSIRSDASRAASIGAIAILIALPVVFLFGFSVFRTITRRLEQLEVAARKVATGEFAIKLRTPGKGFWGRFRGALNAPFGGLANRREDSLAKVLTAFEYMSAELDKARKREADFVARAAHEIRTRLTCIRGFSEEGREALPRGSSQAQPTLDYLVRLEQEIDELTERVSDLLDLEVIEAGQLKLRPEEIRTRGFLLSVAESYRPIFARKRIDYEIEIDPDVPDHFVADADRLSEVLHNLLDNAWKYTGQGGSARFAARTSNGTLELEVRDTGFGIPPDQRERIFEKYSRARNVEEGGITGVGIGLAVARGIVVAHGGDIEVSSVLGEGSTFIVRLPVRPRAASVLEVA